MAERDQEMKRILIEEETQLKNLVAEYKLRFDRERERLLEALRECGRCTKIISEILPTCVNSQKLASDLLSGKPITITDINAGNMGRAPSSDAYRADQTQNLAGDEGFKPTPDAWDLTSIRPGSTIHLKVSGPVPVSHPFEDRSSHAELEESLL